MEIEKEHIYEAWEESIKQVLINGIWIPTQRGMNALEINNLMFTITNPLSGQQYSDKYPFNKQFIEDYINSLDQNYEGISSSERIYNYNKTVNQYNTIKNKLKNSWYSRRAVINLWNPITDNRNNHPPGVISYQFFIRNNQLNLFALLRSNDAWMAGILDILANVSLLKKMARDLNIKIGKYQQISNSYHIYEIDYLKVKQIFSSNDSILRRQ